MKLTWRQIEAFRAIMLTGTVTRAAEFLSISQPAVSTLLSNLEHELGYELFQRHHGRLSVTSEAEAFYPEVERAFVGLDDIAASAAAIGQMQRGILRIATMPALAGDPLYDAVTSFTDKHKNISLIFEVQPKLTVLNWVATSRCDVGISSGPSNNPAIDTELLSTDDTICLLPLGHPLARKSAITPQDLHGIDLVSLPPETDMRRRLEKLLTDSGSVPVRRLETRTGQAMWKMVERGVGVAVNTNFRLSGELARNVVALPFKPDIGVDVLLLFPAHRPKSKLAIEFANHMQAYCHPK